MPTIKRAGIKSREVKTGFESYDGPEPMKRGMYRAKIVRLQYKAFSTGAEGLVITGTLEAQKGDPKGHAIYDGYTITTNLVFGDKPAMVSREENFYAAVGAKDEPNLVTEKGDVEKGVNITKIDGKNPVGVVVNFDIKPGVDNRNNEPRPEVDGVYKYKDAVAKKGSVVEEADEDADEDIEEEPDEDEEVEADEESGEYDERAAELAALKLPALRAAAKEAGAKSTGSKDEVIAAILAAEFETEDEESEEEADEEEDDESEEEDDEEEDDYSARRAELEAMDRNALKKVIKGLDADFKAKTSQTDADLIEIIAGYENETPF